MFLDDSQGCSLACTSSTGVMILSHPLPKLVSFFCVQMMELFETKSQMKGGEVRMWDDWGLSARQTAASSPVHRKRASERGEVVFHVVDLSSEACVWPDETLWDSK